jgi:formate hydrogenlyase subunit 4
MLGRAILFGIVLLCAVCIVSAIYMGIEAAVKALLKKRK